MYVKIHMLKTDVILAACDDDVLGKTFEGNGAKITVSEAFYNGESVSEETYVERMKSVSVMNLVGERAIAIAIEQGHVTPDSVLEIGGVKHAQVVMM